MSVVQVLVVEDDDVLGEELVSALSAHGYAVNWARTGQEGVALADLQPDLVLLDLGLPDIDGIAVARLLRGKLAESVIVVLTARTDEIDVVSALDAGADDYLTKPFRLAEMLARLRAHLRRRMTVESTPVVVAGRLTVDLVGRHARVDTEHLLLRPKELELLALLASNAGRPVRREDILTAVWDEHWFGSTKTLDVHVAALRRKLARAGAGAGAITTLRGFGYRYDTSE